MPGALEPELNELPDSGENEIEGPGNIGAFEKSVTSLFHRKPRAPDSTRWRKNQSTIPLQSELGNTATGQNGLFVAHLQQKFCARRF